MVCVGTPSQPTGELDSATATAVLRLLRGLAQEHGITVIACTHDRIVMEQADRVEELADGKLVTGEHAQVWGHVQAKPVSPFAAGAAASGAGVSSLVGADTSQFGAKTELKPVEKAVLPQREERVEEKREESRDDSRWAKPQD